MADFLPPLVVRLIGDNLGLKATLADSEAGFASFGNKASGLGNTMSKVGGATVAAAAGIGIASLKMAGDFQANMTKLVTSAGETEGGLKTVSNGVLNLATQTGTSTKQLSDGMYMVESAGFHGANGLKVLKAAAEGARAEGAPLKDMANAVTSALKSYNLGANDATKMTNEMVAAVGHGKTTMSEFSGSLSTVLPIAASAHISFDQVSGAIATMTNHGTSAQEATQELANTIRNLQAPNNVAVNEMGQLGISSNDVSTKLGERGLTGTLSYLSETVLQKMGPSGTVLLNSFNQSKTAAADADEMVSKMPASLQKLANEYKNGQITMAGWTQAVKGMPADQANLAKQWQASENRAQGFNQQLKNGTPAAQTYNDAMKKIMGGATGLNTSLMLTGSNMPSFEANVKAIGAAGKKTGSDVQGWGEIQKTFNFQLSQLKERAEVAGIKLGTALMPAIQAIMKWASQNTGTLKVLAEVIGGVLTASAVAWVVKGVAGMVKGFISIGKGAVDAAGKIKGFFSAGGGFDTLRLRAMQAGEGIKGFVKDANGMDPIGGRFKQLGGAIQSMAQQMAVGAKMAAQGVASAAKTAAGAVSSMAQQAAAGGKMAAQGIASGTKAVAEFSKATATAGAAKLVDGVKALAGGAKTAATAVADLTTKMVAQAVAAARAAAAWVAQKVALIASAAAEKIAAAAQWLLNIAMNANPIGLIIIAIVAIIAGLILLYTKCKWFRDFVNVAFKDIGKAAVWIWDKGLKPAFTALVKGVEITWGQVKGLFNDFVNGVKITFGWIKDLIDDFGKGVTKTWNDLWSFVGNVVNGVIKFVQSIIKAGTDFIHGIIKTFSDIFSGNWSKIWNDIIGVVKKVWNDIKGLLPGWLQDFINSIVNFGKSLYNAGWNALMGLWNGISDVANRVIKWVENFAQSIADKFGWILKIFSPSRVFAEHGRNIGLGLIQGLQSMHGAVMGQTSKLADAAVAGFGAPSLQVAMAPVGATAVGLGGGTPGPAETGTLTVTAGAAGSTTGGVSASANGQPLAVQLMINGKNFATALFPDLAVVAQQHRARNNRVSGTMLA